MKIIVLLNKNKENLDFLIKSLKGNLIGNYELFVLDQNNIIGSNELEYNIIKVNKLKNDMISLIESDLNDNYMIIDENKYCYDKVEIDEINNCLKNQEIFCFSLSLGKNITHCSNMNCDNVFISEKEINDIVYWNWSVHYMDFGYPLNLDGTVFRGKELYRFIKNINFENSLELENNLQIFDNYPKETMCCFSTSKIIEIIFENKNEIINFNVKDLKIDRSKFVLKSKLSNEVIN